MPCRHHCHAVEWVETGGEVLAAAAAGEANEDEEEHEHDGGGDGDADEHQEAEAEHPHGLRQPPVEVPLGPLRRRRPALVVVLLRKRKYLSFSKFLGWNDQLDGNKLVSFSLESGQDLRDLWQHDDDCYCCCFERNEMHHSPKRNYQCTETKLNRAKV
jgi:hypothetical protein